MSIAILEHNPVGGFFFPCCSVCGAFLVGDYPVIREDLDHAIHLSHCLEDLENHWGDMSSFEVVENVECFNTKYCSLCFEAVPSVIAVVDFKEGGE